MIAHGEFPREGGEHGELTRGIAFHDLARVGPIDSGIVRDEATIVDVGILAIDATELFLDIGKIVAWIVGHCPVGRRGNNHLLSIRAEIPVMSRVQSRNGGRLPGDSIDAL